MSSIYYTFIVSDDRALRNSLAAVYPAESFSTFAAWRPELPGESVVPALGTLAMSGSLAVEIAQAAHLGVLRRLADACRSAELVVYRAPFPRSLLRGSRHRRSLRSPDR